MTRLLTAAGWLLDRLARLVIPRGAFEDFGQHGPNRAQRRADARRPRP